MGGVSCSGCRLQRVLQALSRADLLCASVVHPTNALKHGSSVELVRQAYETGSGGARVRRGAEESEMSEFVADNGVRVTDEMVRQWAREAESGFEGTQVEPFEGRDWEEVETEPLEPRTIRVSTSV